MMALKAAPAGPNPVNHSSSQPRTAAPAAALTRADSVLRGALQRLHQSPYRGLRGVELDVSGNTMVLTGQVRTFFLKQMAQHLLNDYSRSWNIKNNVRVA
jgi:hypothetical protein